MAEVLSQSQIDALLNSMQGGGAPPVEEKPEKKYPKYDFTSPRKFTKDRLKMLSGIFDNYSRIINTRINGLLRATCEVELASVEEQRYYEFSNALTEGTVLAVSHLNMQGVRDESPVLFYITTPVMLSMIDRLLGGTGDVEPDLPDDYIYTDLEIRLYENLMKELVSVMGNSWENYIQLDFDYGRVEPNPTLVQLIGMDGYNDFKAFLKWDSLNQPGFNRQSIEENCFNLSRTISSIQQADCLELFYRMEQAKRLYAYGSGAVQKSVAKILKNYLILS